jgi:hypothetical protein
LCQQTCTPKGLTSTQDKVAFTSKIIKQVDGKTFSTPSTEDIDHNPEVEELLTPKVKKEIPDANVVMTLCSSSSLHFAQQTSIGQLTKNK